MNHCRWVHPRVFKNQASCCSRRWRSLTMALMVIATAMPAAAQPAVPESLQVVVNSNQDGEIQPDEGLTLREAIALINGTLARSQLSNAEQAQVSNGSSRIMFDLPIDRTTIELESMLPPITRAVEIDGSSQPSYNAKAGQQVPQPVVALTSAPEVEVLRGLTLSADNIKVNGLSLYGFNSSHRRTATTPPADIFVVHQFLPQDRHQKVKVNAEAFRLKNRTERNRQPHNTAENLPEQPPKGILITDNWLGITPDNQMPSRPSAFGVSVFNSDGVTIRNNRISHHDGSAIISGARAESLEISNNKIIGNGLAGMPDAIRLDGEINNGVIRNNLICGNDGSAIYLFKSTGSIEIHDNAIKFNGQRLRRAAIFLMGSDHQVHHNSIHHQTGPGVAVAAYPKSDRNLITNNRFGHLDGLSIDLISRNRVGVKDYQRGDGPNVFQRDTGNRRLDTGKRAVNTPEILSREFMLF
ncbi:MAG: right-handed parallel beta-helix repeat-containing protein [Cyanobacteria bacterium P01_F01_bin.42]